MLVGSFIIHATEVRLMMVAHGVLGATTDLADVDLVETFNLNSSEIIMDTNIYVYYVSAIIRRFVHWLPTTRRNVPQGINTFVASTNMAKVKLASE